MRTATNGWKSNLTRLLALLALLAILAAPAAALAAEAAPKLESLAWLAGSWSGARDGVASEEHWTTAEGGALVGMHKDVKGGRMTSFEFLRIVVDAQGRVCYVASPNGAAPTSFCAVELGLRRVVFENREHDFPQRILYWLDAEDRMHARVEGPMGEREAAEEWVWSRSRGGPAGAARP